MKPASGKAIRIFGWVLSGAVASQAVCLPALAALGGDVTTVETDRVQMKAQVRVASTTSSYTVQEITTPANTVVHEYVSASGKVFAVTWKGPVLPNLPQLLGTYIQDYQAAAQAPHLGHRHLVVEQSDVVIHSYGHMRAFFGNAYVPALLPSNFNLADIK